MNKNLYTVDEIAGMFHLHPRTVRRFIKEGRLKALKIGGQWRIKKQDLREIIGGEPNIEDSSMELAGTADSEKKTGIEDKIQVSSVIDILVRDQDEADRLSNCFIAVLNCKDPDYGNVKYNYIYYEAEKKARFILWGRPKFIGKMLEIISEIS